METSDKKELMINLESKNVRSSIAPLIVLTAATLLLIFCSHILIYRKLSSSLARDKGIVLLWNLDSSAESQLKNGTAIGRVFHDSFHISRRKGLLFEADVIVFDLDNCIKYQDEVRNLPKRSGQTWILFTGSSIKLTREMPANLRHRMDFVLSPVSPPRLS